MSVKKILSLAASTIKLFIIIMLFTFNSKAEENNIKYYSDDVGILSLMYHRFDEDKYPSTNIRMSVFKEHITIIRSSNYKFYDPQNLDSDFFSFIPLCKKGFCHSRGYACSLSSILEGDLAFLSFHLPVTVS